MAFNVQYSFNNGAVTGTATDILQLRQAIYNYAHSGSVSSSTGSDYSHLTQCTLSGTTNASPYVLGTSNEQGTVAGTNPSTITFGIFYGCSNLISLELDNLDLSGTRSVSTMFQNCNSLTILDLTNFNTSSITNMAQMFYGCLNLEHICVGNGWHINSVTSSTDMFTGCTKLPNFNSSVVDKTNAHTGTGGYLENLADIINTAEIYYKHNNTIFKLKAEDSSDATATADDIASGKTAYAGGQKLNGIGIMLPTIEVTATGSYKPSASSNSNYGACINKDGYMVIYAYSYNTSYEHYNFTNASIPATFGTIADGWNLTTTWDTSDNATHLEACTIKGIDISKYSKIKVALNFTGANASYDYVHCDVTITTE